MIIDKVLDTVETVRDLGVIVDQRLKFDAHISSIVHKAMVRARFILRCLMSRNCMLLLKAYMTYVRPILEYCSLVWSPHYKYLINKIESVQKFFTKRLPGLWNLPYFQRLASLNIQSLEHRRILADLTLCFKLQHHYCDSMCC